jgi:hypothetical protein
VFDLEELDGDVVGDDELEAEVVLKFPLQQIN